MLYEMAESLINSIVGGPDYENADVQELRELVSCIKSLCLRVFEGFLNDSFLVWN